MDTSGKIKGLAYASIIAIMLFIISLYAFGIEAFRSCGLESHAVNQVYIAVNTKLRIFNNQLLYKILIIGFLTPTVLFGINKPLKKYDPKHTVLLLLSGLSLFLIPTKGWYYILLTTLGFIVYSVSLIRINVGEIVNDNEDVFNDIEEAFPQEETLRENKYSVNLPMYYFLKNHKGQLEKRKGWINIVNIFRAVLVSGIAGSGKTFSIIEPAMQQLLNKGFAMAVYDFKFPTLAKKTYNYYLKAVKEGAYKKINPQVSPHFYILNFDNPAISHRCNAISPSLLRDDADALNVAINTMCALNIEWRKQADFFANSAMNIFAAILLFLRNYDGGKFCTFPHSIELLSIELDKLIPILLSRRNLQNITKPFENAFKSNAVEQIQGQIASAQIPLARLATENVYYVCSQNDFELDVNDPLEPKVLCVGNNTQKVEAYATPLSLYFYQIIQQVNQQNKWPSCLSIDEFPTIYLSGIDRLVNTARSNKVAVILGYQDNTQLVRDYGEAQANVILNSPGNFLSGQVQGQTAEAISKFFGKKIQRRNSHSISDSSVSLSVNEQLDEIFPANKIANLSQGQIIGKVADNFDQRVKEKLFSCTIDVEKMKQDESEFVDLPIITRFPKNEAPQEFIQEWWNDYSERFSNPDVDYIMSTIMTKTDEENVYIYNPSDFKLTVPGLNDISKQIIRQKFNIDQFNSEDIGLKEKFLEYIIGKLLGIGFLASLGPPGKYYVTIWMRAIIRQRYYQIKKDVEDLVDKIEQELLSDPECLKYFRIEYLQKLQKKFEQQAQEQNQNLFPDEI